MKEAFERLFMNNGLPRMFLSHWLAVAMHATPNRNWSCYRDPILSCSRITFRTLNRITREEKSIWFNSSYWFRYLLSSWPSSILFWWKLVELASSFVASSCWEREDYMSYYKTVWTYLSMRSLNMGDWGSLGSKAYCVYYALSWGEGICRSDIMSSAKFAPSRILTFIVSTFSGGARALNRIELTVVFFFGFGKKLS